ncbi:glycosyltransferase [Priestia megaterium]|uniref:glycosyltransferase n=1 Tax=Priestia megaterium TaxID=1404 RepID=UPI000BF96C4D|nr:glycosyltransferase [Priestia megaterium]AVX07240.1 hypothetical protein CS527_05755 [Bacillus sp. Y-01]MDY0940062.1 glycosyltransferase [Priestia megaterium]PFI64388.1 hypothetical protein COI68_17565 [Priestia megaterium]PGK56619.1 hypothetical protein CN918_13450 [Priestia megaterium]
MNHKRVIYVVKEALHMYPPCVSQILLMNDFGVDVTVICGECDQHLLNEFKKRKIKCIILGNKRISIPKLGKISAYLRFRRKAWRVINQYKDQNTVLWLGTVDSAIALVNKYKKIPYVLSVLELYDKYPFYRFVLKRIIHDASAIIACEDNRARIMKTWWSLERKPYVLPNKPYHHPKVLKQKPTTTDLEAAISKIQGKKVILYQGIISADRDLAVLAEALNDMKSDYMLVLIGKSFYNGADKVREIYENSIYLGYFPAPLHLQITSYAHIGIANYDDSSMNNLFCAPNKIYEYTGFGIPVLGSDVPGLTSTIGTSLAGECVDFSDKNSIIDAINRIEDNYVVYQENARKFFENTDNMSNIKNILLHINS